MAFFLRSKKPQLKILGTSSRFHAVAVKPAKCACAEVRALQLTRFLSNEAPPLPLAGCTVTTCTCRYVHYSDRRLGEDRRDAYRPRVDHLKERARRDRRVSASAR
jgi:hypothetical protein